MSVIAIRLTGETSDGKTVEVHVPLDDIWERIDGATLAAEFSERCDLRDASCRAAAEDYASDEPDWDDDGEDPIFKPLSDWDKDELRKALREDDGRRCIDVLRRAAA